MQFPTLALLALSFAPTISLASTSSRSVCQTKYGPKSSKVVPTSTHTHIFTQTVIRKTTVIPSTTITPKTVTRTVFTDVTTTITSTAPQSTDTLYLTTTFDTTSTSSSTITVIVTTVASTTTTVDGGTTSVSTTTGFIPIQSVSGNPPSRKRAEGNARRIAAAEEKSARSELAERASKGKLQCGFQNGHPYVPSQYPNSVSCEVDIKVITTKTITSTAHKTITSTAKAPTSTITKTRSHTTSTLATPIHASTTVTVSTTMTYSTATVITTTDSTVITNIATATAATVTAYPGCAPDNFISTRNGNQISVVYTSSTNANSFAGFTTSDAVGCCQICQEDSLCGGFAWSLGQCYTLELHTCTPGVVLMQYQAINGDTNQYSYVVGDGNCGLTQWDGVM